jgi:hypothetical protein
VVFGGTSVSSAIVAGVYALAGGFSAPLYGQVPYGHPASLFDAVGGSDGRCSPAYLCTAVPGYDGPTGLGTPSGISGF